MSWVIIWNYNHALRRPLTAFRSVAPQHLHNAKFDLLFSTMPPNDTKSTGFEEATDFRGP
jgi:hypothetical protein